MPGVPEVTGDAGVREHLARIRWCESRDDYTINTGNGHYGAYQFTINTWMAVGGSGYPSDNSPAEQDYRAYILLTQYGAQHWPVCGQR